jgi:hypothetical protein
MFSGTSHMHIRRLFWNINKPSVLIDSHEGVNRILPICDQNRGGFWNTMIKSQDGFGNISWKCSGWNQMEAERDPILAAIDRISVTVGAGDFADLRATVSKLALLFRNVSICSEVVAATSDEELYALVNRINSTEREKALRLLEEFTEYLPVLGRRIIEKMTEVTQSKGGRPPVFNDRNSMRRACRSVLDLIAKGCKESDAKKQVASKLGISSQSMSRAWKERAIILTELSAPEVLSQLLTLLQTTPSNQLLEVLQNKSLLESLDRDLPE